MAVEREGLGFPGPLDQGREIGVVKQLRVASSSRQENLVTAPAKRELVRLDILRISGSEFRSGVALVNDIDFV